MMIVASIIELHSIPCGSRKTKVKRVATRRDAMQIYMVTAAGAFSRVIFLN